MPLRARVLGVSDLNRTFKAIANMVEDGDVADALGTGAEVILEEAKRNIEREGLVKSGALLKSGKVEKISLLAARIIFGVPYAAVHEFGLPKGGKGMFSATARQIRFFWAKWYETGKIMWKALALKGGYTIPPRPYLGPAVVSHKKKALRKTAFELGKAMAKKVIGRFH